MHHKHEILEQIQHNTAELAALLRAIARECPPNSDALRLCSSTQELAETRSDHLLDLIESAFIGRQK